MRNKIDFFARREHFVDHLAPIWLEIPKSYRGKFYVHASVVEYAHKTFHNIYEFVSIQDEENPTKLNTHVPGNNPLVCCAYGDLVCAYKSNPDRTYILAEHGVGLTPAGKQNGGYAGGVGLRRMVDLFLAPNEYIAARTETVLDTTQVVIGTPKLDKYGTFVEQTMQQMDAWYHEFGKHKPNPTICISFHWNGSHISPEAGNAFSIFGRTETLQKLKLEYNMIAHCHPKARSEMAPVFESVGIPFVENFKDVLEQADIYINDCSSTMYEFLVTGKPVIIMNTPAFRKSVHHGLRFWDYVNIGRQVVNYSELKAAIDATIQMPEYHAKDRKKAVKDLYPHLGSSAQRAADAILKFTSRSKRMEEKLLKTKDYPQLIKLLSGHNNSTKGISNIEVEHLSWLGSQIPDGWCALEVGSHRGKSACCIASGIMHKAHLSLPLHDKPVPNVNCIDLWQSGKGKTFDHYSAEETWQIFNEQVAQMGFKDIIKPHKSDSVSASKTYREALKNGKAQPIGLLFIDANHYAPYVEQDFMSWEQFIPSGGVVAFHDYGTRFIAVDNVVDKILKPSGAWTDYDVIGRIFTARKK